MTKKEESDGLAVKGQMGPEVIHIPRSLAPAIGFVNLGMTHSRRLRWPFARNSRPIGEVVSDMTMLMSKVTEVRE